MNICKTVKVSGKEKTVEKDDARHMQSSSQISLQGTLLVKYGLGEEEISIRANLIRGEKQAEQDSQHSLGHQARKSRKYTANLRLQTADSKADSKLNLPLSTS